MARQTIQIDLPEAQKIIDDLCLKNNYSGKTALCKELADIYNSHHNTGIDHQVFGLRLTAGLLTASAQFAGKAPLTPERRAALTENLARARTNPRPKSDSFDYAHNSGIYEESYEERMKERYRGFPVLLSQALKGSRKAKIKLNCISCVGFDDVRGSIGKCTAKACPFYQERPYQHDAESLDGVDE